MQTLEDRAGRRTSMPRYDHSSTVSGSTGRAVGIATIRPTEQGERRTLRIQQYLQNWYRSRALERLQEKTDRYAKQIGVSLAGVSVRNFKSRWGSCDKHGQVVFNWNIIKAPHAIADYVVVHELCHLIHPNHSKDFWQLVGRHETSYSEHKQWLKEKGTGLL